MFETLRPDPEMPGHRGGPVKRTRARTGTGFTLQTDMFIMSPWSLMH